MILNFRRFSLTLFSPLFCLPASQAQANAQIPLSPSSVIGSSGSWDSNYLAGKIFDQQLGVSAEGIPVTYWANKDNTGNLPIYITIDLGAPYSISDFSLFNTHNGNWYDRGTGSFSILASNTITDTGSSNFVLSGQVVTLVQSALASSITVAPLGQHFTSLNTTNSYRYLSFVPTTVASLNPPFSNTAYGLNELQVFATSVPELSGTTQLTLGLVTLGLILRRRLASGV